MQRVIKSLLTLSVLALTFSSSPSYALTVYHGTVTKITDGDTVNMISDAKSSYNITPDDSQYATPETFKIRMVSTDTPETHLPGLGGPFSQGYWGDAAAAQLRDLVKIGDRITLEYYGRDKFGRVLGKIFKDNVDINLEMVGTGWGSLYVICDSNWCEMNSEYRAACRYAVKNGLGMFNPARPIPQLPFLFRAEKQNRPLSKFVGNFRTKKYVRPQDYYKVPICDRVFFITETDARNEGFSRAN